MEGPHVKFSRLRGQIIDDFGNSTKDPSQTPEQQKGGPSRPTPARSGNMAAKKTQQSVLGTYDKESSARITRART